MKYILSLITKQGSLFVNPIAEFFIFCSSKHTQNRFSKNFSVFLKLGFTFWGLKFVISEGVPPTQGWRPLRRTLTIEYQIIKYVTRTDEPGSMYA